MVDAKVYGTEANLSRSPSSMHQPLLHTFDRAKATQELKDGVAVTAAFGKVAYKWAGDEADRRAKAALSACPGGPSNCTEADRWKEGGLYRTALHIAIGGMSFGTAGATGNLAGSLMLNAMDRAIAQLGITDPTAINLLKNLASTMAGAAVGGTSGAAAAFNADTNNRQLHPQERLRLRQLSGGDAEREQRLAAAACFLVRCSAEFPAGSQAREALLALERVGATLTAELDLLRQQSDASGAMFTYGYWTSFRDDATRLNNQYGILQRLGGTAQVIGGTASAIAGSSIAATGLAACAPTAGASCVAAGGGALMVLWGADQITAGSQAIVSGNPTFTLGAHLISEVTGISLGAAELWYALPGVVTGGNAAVVANERTRQLALDWRLASATYGDFAPQGIRVTDQVMASPQAQALMAELRAAGNSTDDAARLAREMIASGSTAMVQQTMGAGTSLFKVVPRGGSPSETSAYWMSATQAQAVSRMSLDQAADFLGLPAGMRAAARQAGGFDYFSMTANQQASVFQSTIAPTVQRSFTQSGGATQVLVPNRNLWSSATRVDPRTPGTFAPRPPGG